MLSLFIRFVCVFSVVTISFVACADPPEVRLTPQDDYKKIPTRRQKQREKERREEAKKQAAINGQSRSIVQDVLLGQSLPGKNAGESSSGVIQGGLYDSQPPRGKDTTSSGASGGGEPSRVDLREFLPVPKMQKMQNCVAWALGYASYSCQVCQQRKSEKPVHDHDLFSPSFIYNKLNHDAQHGTIRDDGLIVTEAIELILEHGCATAKTMPLFNRDLPDSAAENEAGLYRAFGHQKAESYWDIREYLQEGYPVILVVRNSPEFKSNERLPKPYRWQRTDAGMKNLQPHAVCAVGYDDEKQAILVMNSYGDQWKCKGFCWVHYSTLETIPEERTDETEVWCLEAHVVMVKNNNPVVTMSYATGGGYVLGNDSRSTVDVSFALDEDGMVYSGDLRISPDVDRLPQWQIEDLTCNDETIFVLREDQMVARLDNDDDVVTARQHSASWAHLTSGVPNGTQIRMIAAAKNTPLFALADGGQLLRLPAGGYRWRRARVKGVAKNALVDLRDNQSKGPLSLTTNDGRVFTFQEGRRWVLRTE